MADGRTPGTTDGNVKSNRDCVSGLMRRGAIARHCVKNGKCCSSIFPEVTPASIKFEMNTDHRSSLYASSQNKKTIVKLYENVTKQSAAQKCNRKNIIENGICPIVHHLWKEVDIF